MTVDISKIRPGDEVTVRGVATPQPGEGWLLRYGGEDHVCVVVGPLVGCGKAWVPQRNIVTHTPKPLEAGDRVCKGAGVGRGTVLFADERDIVVRWDDGGIHSGPTDGWGATLRRAP